MVYNNNNTNPCINHIVWEYQRYKPQCLHQHIVHNGIISHDVIKAVIYAPIHHDYDILCFQHNSYTLVQGVVDHSTCALIVYTAREAQGNCLLEIEPNPPSF